MTKTIQEQLREDLDAIYIGNLGTVDADLQLPSAGANGSVFRWETGEERFITAEGKVHRPLHGMGNRKVVLTVTAELAGETAAREYTANVLQQVKENIPEWIRPVNVYVQEGQRPVLPPVVVVQCKDGRLTTMPVTWKNVIANEAMSEETTVPMHSVATGAEETVAPIHSVATGAEETITDSHRMTGSYLETDKADSAQSQNTIAIRKICGRVENSAIPAEAFIHVCTDLPADPAPARQAEFIPISDVRLLPGTTNYEYQQRMLEFLRGVNDDTMLYNFRAACGLDTRGAAPMTGWDEASCKLKGHTTGHYLSALALAWSATGEEHFREKIEYVVKGLKECQDAFAASGRYHRGFLSAYSEEQFDLLEVYTKYPEIWAPYYTLDKIMSGLCDACRATGMPEALEVESLMGDWVYARLSRLPQAQLDRMWSMYIAGEFGGMLGTMVKLYEMTGKPEHLAAARLFNNEKLFYPMAEGCDTLEDMHANQHIPQIIGAMDLFRATGEPRSWRIGRNFWQTVTGGHIYCVGGVGETEMFHAADSTCTYLTDKAAESCASYNMLRLTGEIFACTLDARVMDYYENTLCNHILTTCSHAGDGGTIYFLPLGPGGAKEYDTGDNTCCHGTGMESRFRYMEHICAVNEDCVYLNLLVDSRIDSSAHGVKLSLTGSETGQITVKAEATGGRALRIRVPGWAEEKMTAEVRRITTEDQMTAEGQMIAKVQWIPANEAVAGECCAKSWISAVGSGEVSEDIEAVIRGEVSENTAVGSWPAPIDTGSLLPSDGWLTIPAELLTSGAEITLHLPMELRVLENRSDTSFVNVAYGPWILAALEEKKEFMKMPQVTKKADTMEFTDGNVRMIPLNRVDRQAYHVYFRR